MRDKRQRERATLEKKMSEIEGQEEIESQEAVDEIREKFIREMSLDSVHQYPTRHHREWAAAQAYIMKKEGIVDEMRE